MKKGKLNNTSYRDNKVKQFKLSEEDKILLATSHEDFKAIVVKEIENGIQNLIKRVDEMNSHKDSSGKDKSTKKNVVLKLRKLKKELNDEAALKKRIDLLKMRKRKVKSLNLKIEERLKEIKLQKVRCFKCRRRGHTVTDCKYDDIKEDDEGDEEINGEGEKKQEEVEVKPKKFVKEINKEPKQQILCYNCGSKEHNIYGCSSPVNYANMPFAECFICKEKGHLSSKCPTSDKGIYIRGGSCFICKANDHLAKNCPEKQMQIEEKSKENEQKVKIIQAKVNTESNPDATAKKNKKETVKRRIYGQLNKKNASGSEVSKKDVKVSKNKTDSSGPKEKTFLKKKRNSDKILKDK